MASTGSGGERTDSAPSGEAGDAKVLRPGGISYIHLPARDLGESAAFYGAVFGWTVSLHWDYASFEDGTGHVIGAWLTDRAAVGDAGPLLYVYVSSVAEALERVTAHGGSAVREPYPEGDLVVATFRDPAGNVLGLWQRPSE